MKKMFFKKLAHPLLLAGEVCLLTGITLFAVFPISCKVSTSGIEIVGSGYTVPALERYTVISSNELVLEFSEEVNLLAAVLSPFVIGVSDSNEHSTTEELSPSLKSASGFENDIPIELSYSDDKKIVTVNFAEETNIGKMYEFYGEVENKKGSSLTFAVSFAGYNSRMPDLIINEIQTGTTSVGGTEFVELIALSNGNLAGLMLKSVYNGKFSEFQFPAIEVKSGDYITVHYYIEKQYSSSWISETTGDIKLSQGKGSSDFSWDLWAEENDGRLGGTQDIITLENSNTGEILQALLYSKDTSTKWSNKNNEEMAKLAAESGAWEPTGDFDDAYKFPTSARINRINTEDIMKKYDEGAITYPFASNASEWTRVKDSQVTPGNPNTF